MFVVIQSAHSQKLTVKLGGPMTTDGVFVSELARSVVAAVQAKSLRPYEPHTVKLGGGGGDEYAGLEETLAEATRRGIVGRLQTDSILQLSRELHSGEHWVLQHVCQN